MRRTPDLHRKVLVIDSISHLWDACRNAFKGKLTKAGTIPLHAWGGIKKPYKEMMHLLLASPVHVLICGRQGNDFAEDDESGEMKNLGYKMRAEGETAYEPDVLVRLEAHKASKKALAIPVAHIEKDRTGVLAGQSIPSPTFDSLARPLLGLLGTTQAAMQSDEEVGVQDAEALARQEWEGRRRSAELTGEYTERFALTETVVELQRIGGELRPAVKARLAAKDLERVRRAYALRLAALQTPAAELARNGT